MMKDRDQKQLGKETVWLTFFADRGKPRQELKLIENPKLMQRAMEKG